MNISRNYVVSQRQKDLMCMWKILCQDVELLEILKEKLPRWFRIIVPFTLEKIIANCGFSVIKCKEPALISCFGMIALRKSEDIPTDSYILLSKAFAPCIFFISFYNSDPFPFPRNWELWHKIDEFYFPLCRLFYQALHAFGKKLSCFKADLIHLINPWEASSTSNCRFKALILFHCVWSYPQTSKSIAR